MFSLVSLVKTLIGTEASTTDQPNTTGISTHHVKPVIEAIVTQTIAPGRKGQVKFQGSWWTARCNHEITLVIGELVRVIKRQDLTLYIEPLSSIADDPVTDF